MTIRELVTELLKVKDLDAKIYITDSNIETPLYSDIKLIHDLFSTSDTIIVFGKDTDN